MSIEIKHPFVLETDEVFFSEDDTSNYATDEEEEDSSEDSDELSEDYTPNVTVE